MGNYINKGNSDFAEARDERYVDKSGLIAFSMTVSTFGNFPAKGATGPR